MTGLTPDQVLSLNSPISPTSGGNSAAMEVAPNQTPNGPSALTHVGSAAVGTILGWFVLVGVALILGGWAKGG